MIKQTKLIKNLEHALVNKMLPELIDLKKELGLEHIDLKYNFRINANNKLVHLERVYLTIHDSSTTETEVANILTYKYIDERQNGVIICNNEILIEFCKNLKTKIENLKKDKQEIIDIINMELTYKKELLTEKIK